MSYARTSFILVALIAVLFAGCAPAPTDNLPEPRRNLSDEDRDAIIRVAAGYVGAPYRYSGNGKSGFDCSGFIGRVFSEAVGLELPRATRELYRLSRSIHFAHALPGDLVFFSVKMNGRADHVAIYAGSGEFYHASKSKGVIISTFADDYYYRRFFGIRRLKPELLNRPVMRVQNNRR